MNSLHDAKKGQNMENFVLENCFSKICLAQNDLFQIKIYKAFENLR